MLTLCFVCSQYSNIYGTSVCICWLCRHVQALGGAGTKALSSLPGLTSVYQGLWKLPAPPPPWCCLSLDCSNACEASSTHETRATLLPSPSFSTVSFYRGHQGLASCPSARLQDTGKGGFGMRPDAQLMRKSQIYFCWRISLSTLIKPICWSIGVSIFHCSLAARIHCDWLVQTARSEQIVVIACKYFTSKLLPMQEYPRANHRYGT